MSKTDIVDIGVNLAHRSFQRDRREVVERAFAAGVRTMIVTGTSVASSEEGLRIAREYPGQLFSTAGVHPHDSKNCTEQTMSELRRLAAHKEVVAMGFPNLLQTVSLWGYVRYRAKQGECGLDFNRDFSPRPLQEKWFEAQVALAEELKRPLFLHERDAQERFCAILKAARKGTPAVIHCFTGGREELRTYRTYLDMGLHIGITGWICDERRGIHLREVVKEIPLERLMIETDAPFLLPRTMASKPKDGRNEPAFLTYVLETLAKSLGKPESEVAEATTRTARKFFRIEAAGGNP